MAPFQFATYWGLYFLLVVGFTFFYTDVMVRQQNIPQTLQRQGGFIPGIRPGQTHGGLHHVRGAPHHAGWCAIPGPGRCVARHHGPDWFYLERIPGLEQSAYVITGAGLIIVVGVVLTRCASWKHSC